MYKLDIIVQAKTEIAFLKKIGGKAVTKKIEKLLQELIEHPKTGTGQVEQLKGNMPGKWSRRIDKKLGGEINFFDVNWYAFFIFLGQFWFFAICKYPFYAPNQSHLPVVLCLEFHR